MGTLLYFKYVTPWNIRGYRDFEATVGFEPTNKGFADLRLKPLGHVAIKKNPQRVDFFERETGLGPATATLAR